MTSNELEIFKQSILDDVRVMMQTTSQVTQYIGARYVPLFADPLDWNSQMEYEPLTIVLNQGNSFTSRQFVPKGIDISNTDFWANTGNYNAQIEQYRQEVKELHSKVTNKLTSVNTVNELKALEDATVGMIVKTNGFHSVDDGGAAYYNIIDNGPANEKDIIALNSGLFAELIITDTMNPCMFGCYGDGIHDDTEVLNYILQNGDFTIVSSVGKHFKCSDTITITKRRNIDFGLAEFIFENSTYGFLINMSSESDNIHERFAPIIRNIVINGKNCSICIYVQNGYKATIENIYINNFNNIGLRKDSGYELVINNIWCHASKNSTNSVGIYAYGNDCEYGNLFGANCHTGVKMRGGANHFSLIHFWLYQDEGRINGNELYQDSAMIELETGGNDIYHIDYAYFDSYQYGIKYNGFGNIYIDSAFCLFPALSNLSANYNQLKQYLIYAENANLNYISRIVINNYYLRGNSLNKSNIFVIPENYNSRPLSWGSGITESTFTNNIPTDFSNKLTIENGEFISKRVTQISNDFVQVSMIVKSDTSSEQVAVKYPDWMKNLNNIVVIGFKDSNRYFTGKASAIGFNLGDKYAPLDEKSPNTYYSLTFDVPLVPLTD